MFVRLELGRIFQKTVQHLRQPGWGHGGSYRPIRLVSLSITEFWILTVSGFDEYIHATSKLTRGQFGTMKWLPIQKSLNQQCITCGLTCDHLERLQNLLRLYVSTLTRIAPQLGRNCVDEHFRLRRFTWARAYS
ncbi:hypothetical protein BH23CHL4_BH23CHL4_23060 [soil metagenome]